MTTVTNNKNQVLSVGDIVLVQPHEEYAGLVGVITEVILLGSREHDTGNPTDDIVVNLSQEDYSSEKKAEILDLANKLGYEADSYEQVSLDGVILAPNDLIKLTKHEFEFYKDTLMSNMEDAIELATSLY